MSIRYTFSRRVIEFFSGMFEPFAHPLPLIGIVALTACAAFTSADRSALLAAEGAACAFLAPLTGLPEGIEASACAAAENATKALPVSEAHVRAAASAMAATAPTAETERPVRVEGVTCGRVSDHRARRGVAFPK